MYVSSGFYHHWSRQEALLLEDASGVSNDWGLIMAIRASDSCEGTWWGIGKHPNLLSTIASTSVVTASRMPSLVFAETSTKAIPHLSASCWPISSLTCLFASPRSLLVPISIIWQLSSAFCLASSNRFGTFMNERRLVVSYISSIPLLALKYDFGMLLLLSEPEPEPRECQCYVQEDKIAHWLPMSHTCTCCTMEKSMWDH